MGRCRWGRAFVGTAALLLAALFPAVAVAPPAAATHTLSFLQVTPEISSVAVGSTVTLTARLFNPLLPTRTPVTATVQTVDVHFRFEGGPLAGTPERTCTVALLQSTCTLDLVSPVSGTSLVRGWIDGHTPDAEGRLANTLPESDVAADCIGPDHGDIDAAACRSGDVAAAGLAEPDENDVVRITWRDRGLDVQPDNQARALGETATLTATATDLAGNPVAGVPVKFEFFDASASDPGGGSTPNNPDRTCTTGAAGSCAIAVTSPPADGVDLVCAWTSASPPTMTGRTAETVTCDGEALVDATANDGKPSPVDDDQDVVRIQWGTPPPTAGTTPTVPPATPPPTGYWLVAADGGIFAFGDATFLGSTGALRLNRPVVAMAATPSRQGYFLVASDGGVFAFGDATFRGSTGAIRLNQPMVGMAATPLGNGYFLVARDGGIFAFGDAVFRGSTGAIRLNQPIVGMATTPSGNGYFLVAADGGIFAFGDAVFRGSTGAIRLAQPIVGMATTPSGNGYFLVAADGGVFAFGDAVFRGSTGAIRLAQPMVGMSRSNTGAGYRLVARDGGVFAFGDATFRGSTGAIRLNQPMVGMAGF